jgi:hypothetical protein
MNGRMDEDEIIIYLEVMKRGASSTGAAISIDAGTSRNGDNPSMIRIVRNTVSSHMGIPITYDTPSFMCNMSDIDT